MNQPITRTQLIETIRRERARLEEVIAQLPAGRVAAPGTMAGWSAKDIVAHICWGEHKIVGLLRTRMLTDADLFQMAEAERDAVVYQREKDRDWVEVRAEASKLEGDVVAAIMMVEEADLADASRFEGLPEGVLPWQFIAANTYEHYREHLPHLQALV